MLDDASGGFSPRSIVVCYCSIGLPNAWYFR